MEQLEERSLLSTSVPLNVNSWTPLGPAPITGATLPGGFVITARKTYGRNSDGMICSARELDLGDDHKKLFDLQSWGSLPIFQPLLDAGRRFQDACFPVIDPDRLLYVAGYGQETPAAVRAKP